MRLPCITAQARIEHQRPRGFTIVRAALRYRVQQQQAPSGGFRAAAVPAAHLPQILIPQFELLLLRWRVGVDASIRGVINCYGARMRGRCKT